MNYSYIFMEIFSSVIAKESLSNEYGNVNGNGTNPK